MKSRTLSLVLVAVFALCGAIAAQGVPELTAKERAARLKALPEEDRKWVEEFVAPIILPDEKNLYLQLTEPHQREIFKRDFWERRERPGLPPPLGPGYQKRYENLRELAATTYDGLLSDTGRIIVLRGEPDSVKDYRECNEVFRNLEVWTYGNARGGSAVRTADKFLFYRPSLSAPRKLWNPSIPEGEIVAPSSCLRTVTDSCREKGSRGNANTECPGFATVPQTCDDACDVAVVVEQLRARGVAEITLALSTPPKVDTEGLDKLAARFPTLGAKKATPLEIEGPAGESVVASSPSVPKISVAPASNSATAAGRGVPELTAKERAARIKALPEEDRKWVEEFVGPIILPDEKNLYLQLTEPHQREIFVREFWERRERPGLPEPLGPGYRNRYEGFREAAATSYGGLTSDTGRVVVLHGEPLAVQEFAQCTDVFRDLAVWSYRNAAGGGSLQKETQFLFYRSSPGAPWRLWYPAIPDRELLAPGSCLTSVPQACRPIGSPPSPDAECGPYAAAKTCQDACDVVRIIERIRARGVADIALALSQPPKVDTEGLEKLADRFPTLKGDKATALTVEGPSSGDAVVPSSPSAKVSSGPETPEAAASRPAPARKKLSKKEIRERTEALPQKYRDFVNLVELIITDDEREVFLQIAEGYQRDKFIDAFWKRRTIDSMGIRTDYRAVYTRRVEQAISQFRDLHNDRAKMFVMNGPPDAVVPIDCQEVYVPLQIWFYERIEALKSKVYLIFYQPYGTGAYKLWLPIDGVGVLYVGVGSSGGMAMGARTPDIQSCFEWRTVQQALQYSAAVLGSGAFSMQSASLLFRPPSVETEGVDQILSMTTDVREGATALGVARLVRFPELRANKIGMDLSLLVPKAELRARSLGEESFYNVDVIGEVVKDDRLIDNFKYRFDIPTQEIAGEKIPVTVRRYLYPGQYKLILKISDGNQNAEGHLSEALTVPEQPDAPPPEVLAARADGKATVDKIKDIGLLPSAIALLPVAKEIVTGLQRFETRASENVKTVDFYLNGSKIMTRTKAPFEADLNLGPLPRKQTVRVVAFGPSGRSVGEDEYIVNEGREVFRVRILSPDKGSRVSGPTKVVAAIAVPEGRTLQKLEFYSNEARVATLYQAPYEQTVNVKDSKSLSYVRVIGTLDDGTLSEDLRYVNAPDFVSEVTVDAVELYTTVTEKNRPVSHLQASNFKVFEDGVLQTIQGFEYVKNLPLSLGIIVDTSASMLESLPDAEQAALKFIDFSVGQKDRAFVVSFDNEPYLLAKLTGRKDKLVRSLAGLRAEGSTALYDAIIYGLYQFTGVKGKRALVILTDGKDTVSKFDYDTLVEYVRKSGLAVYGIGLKISGTDLEVKYKLNKIAQVSGGQTFYIDSAKNLEAVYRQINEDLRSQYLLTYYSSNVESRDQWRKVEIKVEPVNLQARTISGYYP